ncbi:MAG: hypothetical protein Q8K79_05800 [Solirubrobacteraceae bacterium]|nr:hypothetical protein [Solirubrobacteraceae bacterium]
MSTGATATGDHVAFGFRLHGVPARALIPDDRPDWPALHVTQRLGPAGSAPGHLGESGARLSLGGEDWLELDRGAQTATYRTLRPVDEDTLIHPRLAPAAALMARWLDREALHAGAFVAAGGAWGVAGANQAGKSTLLAGLALRGTPVFSDDLLVIDRAGFAYAGPRCIDLRRPEVLGAAVGDGLRSVREETRRRMDLPPVAAVAPLRGWFFLDWGSRVEALPCRAGARLGGLLAQRRWATQAIDPHVLLALAALPTWTLRRPPGAEHLAATLALLDELTAAAGSRGSEAAA